MMHHEQYEAIASRFQLHHQLGQGCFATVYLATHLDTGLDVAVKIISKAKCTNFELIKNEVAALQLVNEHPNIVDVYEVAEDAQCVYIVMEYCAGGNLHDFIVANGSLSESGARLWFGQLVTAVEYCHGLGVVNADIKNANVLIDDMGNIKLSDFGLASIVKNAYTDRVGRATGSAVFAAPEVYWAHHGIPFLGPIAEVWALGGVLHSMLTATLPFAIQTYQETWSHYTAPEDCSREVGDLLSRMYQFVPSLRPSTAELLQHPWMTAAAACSDSAAVTPHSMAPCTCNKCVAAATMPTPPASGQLLPWDRDLEMHATVSRAVEDNIDSIWDCMDDIGYTYEDLAKVHHHYCNDETPCTSQSPALTTFRLLVATAARNITRRRLAEEASMRELQQQQQQRPIVHRHSVPHVMASSRMDSNATIRLQ